MERVKEVARKIAPQLAVRVLPPYFDAPGYIRSLAAVAGPSLAAAHDHVLFSFHGSGTPPAAGRPDGMPLFAAGGLL